MDRRNKVIGGKGECEAEAYLKKIGYRILDTNYHTPLGEIDIIALDGDILVFVEVKTRSSDKYGSGFYAVAHKKQIRMTKAALLYITKKEYDFPSYRFDVVSILNNNISIVKNAFLADAEFSF
ncbi:YraN family protein [bacterium]|nr:YraN family protein [bacterium]